MRIFINNAISLIFVIPLLFSCTTHYVSQWSNYDREQVLEDDGSMKIKNDTIGISHAFNNLNGRVTVRIENYSQYPMLVNLTKSALTINGRTFGYVDGKSTISGWIDTFGTGNGGNFGAFGGEIEGKPNTMFVPPFSYVEGSFANIQPEIKNIVGSSFQGDRTDYPVFRYPISTNLLFYEESNSPMKITSYINYSLIDKDNNPIVTRAINQNFYMSGFFEVKNMSKQDFNRNLLSREDLGSYSISRGHGFGLVLFLSALVGLAAIAADAEE